MAFQAANRQVTHASDLLRHYPWLDYATASIPDNWDDIVRWSRYFWMTNGDWAQSMHMVAAYFITDVDFADLEDEEEDSYSDFFNDDLEWKLEIEGCGLDFLAYGEIITTLYIPIRRYLRCPHCGFEEPIEQADFDWSDFKFKRTRPCKSCHTTGGWLQRVDRKDQDMSKVRLVRWNPQYIDIYYQPISQRREVYLRIPQNIKRDIQNGIPGMLRDVPWEFVECVQKGVDLEFDDDAVFYRDMRTISGVMENGRGLPRSMHNYRLFWHIQTLNRQDQAVAIDYITGPRIWSPAPHGANAGQAVMSDPLLNRDGGDFVGQMNNILMQQKRDPTRHFTAPHPVQYQFAGGEGKQISPWEMINMRKEELLHASGVPVEFYKLNLQSQGAPMMLRLFEMMWSCIPAMYNALLQWIVDRLVQHYQTENTKARLTPTHIADDLERKQALLTLMAGNQIAPQTALAPFGIKNIRDEIRKVFEHQLIMAEESQKFEEEMLQKQEQGVLQQTAMLPTPSTQAMAAQGGGAPPGAAGGGAPPGGVPGAGGAPMATGQGADTSMADLEMMAQQQAEQLVGLPYEQRRPILTDIKKSNPALHAMVTAKLEEIRSQAKNEGGYQMIQQAFGAGAPAPMM